MKQKKISQTEARKLRRRVAELEGVLDRQRRRWASDYPGGVEICSARFDSENALPVAVRTARSLGHAVVVIASNEGYVRFQALPLPRV